jgi:CRISPR type I-E-associated protein CasB/Cse2
MNKTPTAQYIERLIELKTGDLGLLRANAGRSLNDSVLGFDLFSGLWWPLREKNQRAPKREVAWLIAKLYAFSPIQQSDGETLAIQLRKCQPKKKEEKIRFTQKFDEMINLPLNQIEGALQWAISEVADAKFELDWVKLTDDLSIWHRENVRLRWTEEFLNV